MLAGEEHFGKRLQAKKRDLPHRGGTATAARQLFLRYCPARQDIGRWPQ
jgi:hypothetical protein